MENRTALQKGAAPATPCRVLRRKLGASVLLAIAVIGGLAAFQLLESGLDAASAMRLLAQNCDWAALLVILLMIAHCFAPFPAELLALAAGAIFGVAYGAALIWIGAMIGAALSFGLARWLGRPFVESVLPARHLKKLDRWADDDPAFVLLLSRFVPLIAFNLINYAAGLTPVRWRTFLWTTGVGILPITVLTTWLGAEMRTFSWPILLAVIAACVAVATALHAARRLWR